MCLLLRLAQGLTLTSSSIRFCLDTLNCGKLQTYAALSMLLFYLHWLEVGWLLIINHRFIQTNISIFNKLLRFSIADIGSYQPLWEDRPKADP